MQREIDLYKEEDFSGKNLRLFKEWDLIDKRSRLDNSIEYTIRKRNGLNLPTSYEITFNVKSITGVEEKDEQGLQKPIFGDKHVLRINLPNNFPCADAQPEFIFKTDVWHPNIRYFGDFKGKVCLNLSDAGLYTNLITYIDRVMDYLTYRDYFAVNEYPYPEDLEVANWVITQAEVHKWLNFK